MGKIHYFLWPFFNCYVSSPEGNIWGWSLPRIGGFLSHRATPSHPFIDGAPIPGNPGKPPIDGKIVHGPGVLGCVLGDGTSLVAPIAWTAAATASLGGRVWVCRNGISWGFIGISRGYDGIYHGIFMGYNRICHLQILHSYGILRHVCNWYATFHIYAGSHEPS